MERESRVGDGGSQTTGLPLGHQGAIFFPLFSIVDKRKIDVLHVKQNVFSAETASSNANRKSVHASERRSWKMLAMKWFDSASAAVEAVLTAAESAVLAGDGGERRGGAAATPTFHLRRGGLSDGAIFSRRRGGAEKRRLTEDGSLTLATEFRIEVGRGGVERSGGSRQGEGGSGEGSGGD